MNTFLNDDRLLLLTMTQERREDISLMIKNIYPAFDGIVALVNQPSNDGTFEILEQNKGNGRILKQNWTKHHGFLMNHLLFYGGIKEGTYCVFLDSPESMTDEFIKILPDLIQDFKKNDVGALFWDGRPYVFRYTEYLEFFNAVHWSLSGIEGKIITLPDKDKYIVNRRHLRPEVSFCENPIKYWFCYPLGNEVNCMYSKYGGDVCAHHEAIRRQFRWYCKNKLGLNTDNLSGLIDYMKGIENKEIIPEDYFVDIVEIEFRLSELYQLKVLNYDFMGKRPEIKNGMHSRYRWSFKNHLKFGSGWHDQNHEGTILKYEKQLNAKQ